jgi:hypothetical protein
VFEASHPFALFDYFRVPYEVRPLQHAEGYIDAPISVCRLCPLERSDRAQRSLLWLGAGAYSTTPRPTYRLGRYQLQGCTLFGHVAPDSAVSTMLQQLGHSWRPVDPILDADARPVASIWMDRDGNVFLPFDPGEVMNQFWSENYQNIERSPLIAAGRAVMLRGYYLARPAMSRHLQLRLRRAFTRIQARATFPRWPIEDSLHDLYKWLLVLVAELAGRPVPYIDLWPGDRSWALVLTHDVETSTGYRDMHLLRDIERELGYSSSWNFVALRYHVHAETVRALQEEGCEIGVHGLLHDGHDLGPTRLMKKRLPAMRAYAAQWNAVGFRSPATQRAWELMPKLGFEYDSSYSDTDPYEPQPGGCCTYLPYFNENMVELPITLPQDHTMFFVLQESDADHWLHKAQQLRARHAMVLVLTHPDYARDARVTDGYRRLLNTFQGDDTVWHALPKDVAAWWRKRSASTICHDGESWTIEGPASIDGRVRFATADGF